MSHNYIEGISSHCFNHRFVALPQDSAAAFIIQFKQDFHRDWLGKSPDVIDTPSNADIMSDMKTFTVRDLDRIPGVVLEASRIDGRARVRERGGQSYLITPEASPQKRIAQLPDFSGRRAGVFKHTLSEGFARKLDEAVSGE